MTSAEKVEAIRRALAAEIAAGKGDPTLATLWGTWRLIRPFAARPLAKVLDGFDLTDPVRLDDLLGLLAGVALELRSDDADELYDDGYHNTAKELIARLGVEV